MQRAGDVGRRDRDGVVLLRGALRLRSGSNRPRASEAKIRYSTSPARSASSPRAGCGVRRPSEARVYASRQARASRRRGRGRARERRGPAPSTTVGMGSVAAGARGLSSDHRRRRSVRGRPNDVVHRSVEPTVERVIRRPCPAPGWRRERAETDLVAATRERRPRGARRSVREHRAGLRRRGARTRQRTCWSQGSSDRARRRACSASTRGPGQDVGDGAGGDDDGLRTARSLEGLSVTFGGPSGHRVRTVPCGQSSSQAARSAALSEPSAATAPGRLRRLPGSLADVSRRRSDSPRFVSGCSEMPDLLDRVTDPRPRGRRSDTPSATTTFGLDRRAAARPAQTSHSTRHCDGRLGLRPGAPASPPGDFSSISRRLWGRRLGRDGLGDERRAPGPSRSSRGSRRTS